MNLLLSAVSLAVTSETSSSVSGECITLRISRKFFVSSVDWWQGEQDTSLTQSVTCHATCVMTHVYVTVLMEQHAVAGQGRHATIPPTQNQLGKRPGTASAQPHLHPCIQSCPKRICQLTAGGASRVAFKWLPASSSSQPRSPDTMSACAGLYLQGASGAHHTQTDDQTLREINYQLSEDKAQKLCVSGVQGLATAHICGPWWRLQCP